MSRRARIALILVVSLAIVAALALVAVLVFGGSTETSASPVIEPAKDFGPVGSTEQVPCPSVLKEGASFAQAGDEVEGKTYSCGVVVVPEDHAKPDGRTIELFYLKLMSTGDSPQSDPLVYLAGGPGGSGTYDLTANALLYQNLGPIREDRDIIAYDQRGTGFSSYLLCAPFESTLGILQDRDKNPKIAATIKDLQSTTLGIGYGALRANLCGVGTRLLAGVDLGQYNSVSSAKDIPQLVKALGYSDGYSLYGTSYGTRLAQYAMRAVPDGIRGVVLDGPVGTATPSGMWSATKPASPYVELLEECVADAACNAAYPNIADRFGALLTKLEKKPLVFDPPLVVFAPLSVAFPPVLKQIDPEFFRRLAVVNNIAVGGGFAAQVPQMIEAAERGDAAFFRTTKLAATDSDKTAPQTSVPSGGGTPAFKSDQPLFEVPFVTLLSIAQTAASQSQAQATVDTQWLTVVLDDLAARLQAGDNQADLMEALLRLAVVPNTGTSARQLTDYADANLSPAAATAANAIARKMTRNDVRATMWSIQDLAMTLGNEPDQRSFSTGMQNAFNCSDDLAFSSLDQAKADLARTPYPQLAAFPPKFNEQLLATCLSYPTVLDRSVTKPVVSDIPTLVYVGALDNETPAAWGRDVAKRLRRGTLVEWRNQGHVAAAKDPELCPGNIAAAFLRDPSSEPDVACSKADAYKLQFVVK